MTNNSSKIFDYFVIFMMLLFSYLQLNDPDPFIWTSIYLLVAVIVFFSSRGYFMRIWFQLLSLALLIYSISLVPIIVSWVQIGMPSLTGEMKAEMPEIEKMRELGGIIICLIIALVYWRRSSK